MVMVSDDRARLDDHAELAQAADLIAGVMERHRGEDLRVVALFSAALQDIRIGERYLAAADPG